MAIYIVVKIIIIKKNNTRGYFMKQKKTVTLYSEKLSDIDYYRMDKLFVRYGNCRDYFLKSLCTFNSMVIILHWQKIRNQVRKNEKKIIEARKKHPRSKLAHQRLLSEKYRFPGRYWVEALQEACATLNSIWECMAYIEKGLIIKNKNLTDDMKQYLFYVLKARIIWQAILLKKESSYKGPKNYLKLRNRLTDKELKYCFTYLRRITRSHRSKPRVKSNRSIWCDDPMYSMIKKDKNKVEFRFMSQKKEKRFCVDLTSPYCYSKKGDIRIILDRDKHRIEVHKLIYVNTKINNYKPKVEGGDKGNHAIISMSSGNEYGINYNKITNKEALRVLHRRYHRTKYFKKDKSFKKKIKELKEEQKKHVLSKQKQKTLYNLQSKHQSLQVHHLGTLNGNRHHNKFVAHSASFVNKSLRQMIRKEQITFLAKEDLTFVTVTKKANTFLTKLMRIYWSFWNKGYINERIEYLCDFYGIKYQDVNAAYTSQYCPHCHCKILYRFGRHKEFARCPICGIINANTIAGENIKSRLYDKEITLSTPHKEVKKIMDKRMSQAGQAFQKQYADVY